MAAAAAAAAAALEELKPEGCAAGNCENSQADDALSCEKSMHDKGDEEDDQSK